MREREREWRERGDFADGDEVGERREEKRGEELVSKPKFKGAEIGVKNEEGEVGTEKKIAVTGTVEFGRVESFREILLQPPKGMFSGGVVGASGRKLSADGVKLL